MIMKFALHMHTKEDILRIYEVVRSLELPYSTMNFNHEVMSKKDSPLSRNFFVVEPKKFGTLKPVITMNGICQAWIPFEISNPYQQSQFITNFEEIFGLENKESLPIDLESHKIFRFIGYESNYVSNIKESSNRYYLT